jgi:F-type H+-transporting ATPase subunit gamma
MRPYSQKLTEILQNLSASLDASESKFSSERDVNKVLIIAITSNRGLCGGFNSYVNKKVGKLITEDYAGKEVKIVAIGKKAADFWKKQPDKFISEHNAIYDDLTFENSSKVAEWAMEAYINGEFDRIGIVYNEFKNAATFLTSAEQFLPVAANENADDTKSTTDYIFQPAKEEILEDLIPLSLKTQLFKSLLDSHAAEHGARMTAMHKATDNATDLLKELKLSYNKARQASITNEILEIVGGAAALEDS